MTGTSWHCRVGDVVNALILASASPRRSDLLRSIGLEFEITPADIDETQHAGEVAVAYVERVAAGKADAVAERLADLAGCAILAADTTVEVDGEILAKPTDDADARRMLRLLSGTTHQVHTAVVGVHHRGTHRCVVRTDVTFALLSEAEIDWYLSMGEHRDKAGAYGLQGAGSALVHRIDGSVSNVIGLPLAETVGILRACSVDVLQPRQNLR
jgi:septum formation protein